MRGHHHLSLLRKLRGRRVRLLDASVHRPKRQLLAEPHRKLHGPISGTRQPLCFLPPKRRQLLFGRAARVTGLRLQQHALSQNHVLLRRIRRWRPQRHVSAALPHVADRQLALFSRLGLPRRSGCFLENRLGGASVAHSHLPSCLQNRVVQRLRHLPRQHHRVERRPARHRPDGGHLRRLQRHVILRRAERSYHRPRQPNHPEQRL